jgi:hypothetical protein
VSAGTSHLGLLAYGLLTASICCCVVVATALPMRRYWASRPYLAAPFGLVGLGLTCYALFYVWLFDDAAGRICSWLVVAVSVVVCSTSAVRIRRGRPGPPASRGELTAVLAICASVLTLHLSLTTLWDTQTDLFTLARVRFSHPLPVDNQLPEYISRRLLAGDDPRGIPEMGGWQSSDRPPLQSGLILLTAPVTAWTGLDLLTRSALSSLVAQLVWIPGAFALLRALGSRTLPAVLGTVFAACSGTILLNTVFTWPKLLSAGLLLAGLAVAWDARDRRARGVPLVVAAALTTLAFLAHGTAVFAAPLVLAAMWAGQGAFRRPRTVLLPSLAASALYLPWMAYQHLYDPPGNRLLLYQLAGVLEVSDEPLGHALARTYGQSSLTEIVHDKLANLRYPFAAAPWSGWTSISSGVAGRRAAEFYHMSAALGLGALPLAGLLVWSVLHARQLDPSTARVLAVLAGAGGCLVVWALVLRGPGYTYLHVGSHSWLIMALTLPLAWWARDRPGQAGVLCVVQAGLLLVVYVPGGGAEQLQLVPLVGCAVGLGGLVLTTVVVIRRERALGSADTAPHPVTRSDDGAGPGTRELPVGYVRGAAGPEGAGRRRPVGSS